MPIQSYRELDVWKKSMALAKQAYVTTRPFPKEETYGLTSQLRRAASSIPANIAEGRTRGGRKEFIYFLNIANGSLAELETHLLLAQDLEYCSSETTNAILACCTEVGRMLNAMIRALSNPVKTDSRKLEAESSHP
jgi:four helix bundle protein